MLIALSRLREPFTHPSVWHPAQALKGGNIFPGPSRRRHRPPVAASLLPGKHLPVVTRWLRHP